MSNSTLVDEYAKKIKLESYPSIRWANGNPPSVQSGASGDGQLFLTDNENAELNTHLRTMRDLHLAAHFPKLASAVTLPIPRIEMALHFWGIGVDTQVIDGRVLSRLSDIATEVMEATAAYEQDQAQISGKTASYERRADDWRLEANTAAHELMQMGRQIISSLIAEQVAEHEYNNAKRGVENSLEVEQKLRSKFTNAESVWLDAGGDQPHLPRILSLRLRDRTQGGTHDEAGTDAAGVGRDRLLESQLLGFGLKRSALRGKSLPRSEEDGGGLPRQQQARARSSRGMFR